MKEIKDANNNDIAKKTQREITKKGKISNSKKRS